MRAQVAADFTPVHWPEIKLADWLIDHLPDGATVGFDPWLHTVEEIEGLTSKLAPKGITLRPGDNLIDQIWTDRPAPPMGRFTAYPLEHAGESHDDKRARLADTLRRAGQGCDPDAARQHRVAFEHSWPRYRTQPRAAGLCDPF